MLEDRGPSDGGPAGPAVPGGCRAGCTGSVLQDASLGGVKTGGTAASALELR